MGIDTRFSYSLNDDDKAGAISAHIGVGTDLASSGGVVSSSYIGGGSAFDTEIEDIDTTVFSGGVGYEILVGDGVELTIGYEVQSRDDIDSEWFDAKVRWAF